MPAMPNPQPASGSKQLCEVLTGRITCQLPCVEAGLGAGVAAEPPQDARLMVSKTLADHAKRPSITEVPSPRSASAGYGKTRQQAPAHLMLSDDAAVGRHQVENEGRGWAPVSGGGVPRQDGEARASGLRLEAPNFLAKWRCPDYCSVSPPDHTRPPSVGIDHSQRTIPRESSN